MQARRRQDNTWRVVGAVFEVVFDAVFDDRTP